MQKNQQAFTLIELLVVVLIIGILSAIALPQYRKAVLKSRAVEMIGIGRALVLAEEAYKLETGSYATTAEKDNLAISLPNNILSKYTIGLYNDENARANIQGSVLSWDFRFGKNKQALCYAPVGTIGADVCRSITGGSECSDVMNGTMFTYCAMPFM